MIERIAILGTGLLGTSVGLALRAAGFGGSIVGWNRTRQQAEVAMEMGALHSIAGDALQAARESQVVVVAVPIHSTLDYMEQLSRVLGTEHLVTDVGSTKAQITAAASRLFNTPERAGFLPGHPMAGKERGGAALGDANLFRGRSGVEEIRGIRGARERVAGVRRCDGFSNDRSRPGTP
jgi:prephenate dehydrogenase